MSNDKHKQLTDTIRWICDNLHLRSIDHMTACYHETRPEYPTRVDSACIELNMHHPTTNCRSQSFHVYPQYNVAVFFTSARGMPWDIARNRKLTDTRDLLEQMGYEILEQSNGFTEQQIIDNYLFSQRFERKSI